MLCLSRQKEEALVITTPSGERVEITILETRRHLVRLGFEADRGVRIMRKELLDRPNKEPSNGIVR